MKFKKEARDIETIPTCVIDGDQDSTPGLKKAFNYPHVTKVIIRKFDSQEINLDTLQLCRELKELEIIQNLELISLNFDELAKFRNFESFNLYDNRSLEILETEALGKCNQLKKIILVNNGLTNLDLTPLENCRKLEKLIIAEKNLKYLIIPPNLVQQLKHFTIGFRRSTRRVLAAPIYLRIP